MKLFERTGVVCVRFDEVNQILSHEWFNYNPEGKEGVVLRALEKIYQLHLKYPVKKVMVIADKSHGTFSAEAKEFIRTTQFPRLLSDTRIQFIAKVKPVHKIGQFDEEMWGEPLTKESPLVSVEISSAKHGVEWLNSIESKQGQFS